MHKSRLAAFVIDCDKSKGEFDAAADFWSRALGRPLAPPDPASPTYRTLEARPEEPMLLLQQVEHPGRVHLDIESDDVEAEVKRLEALGARRVTQVRTWWVLEAPSGQRFCVVRPQRGEAMEHATTWPGPT